MVKYQIYTYFEPLGYVAPVPSSQDHYIEVICLAVFKPGAACSHALNPWNHLNAIMPVHIHT